MKNFRDLDVYKRSSGLFPKIYKMVRLWNQVDQRELGSQMIRAANSIHANIAEGYGKSPNEFKRYLTTAIGSCDELVSHLTDASNVNLMTIGDTERFVKEYIIVGKQLMRLKQNWK